MNNPKTALWEITHNCNFACAHCLVNANGRGGSSTELTLAACARFFREFKSVGVGSVCLSGGEPLICEDIVDLMNLGRTIAPFEYCIATNGYCVSDDLVARMKAAGLSYMQISIDGSTPEEFAVIRKAPPDAFERCWEAVKICRRQQMPVSAGMFLHPCNIQSVPRMVRLVADSGMHVLRFSGIVPIGRAGKDSFLNSMSFTTEQLVDFLSFLDNYDSTETGVALCFDHGFGPIEGKFRCVAGVESFYVSYDGSVYPCPSLIMPEFLCGNLYKDSLRDMMRSPKMLKSHVPAKKIGGRCAKCSYLEHCKGACRGVAFAVSGDLYAECPNCLLDFYWKALRAYPERFPKKTAACADKAAESQANAAEAAAEIKGRRADNSGRTRPKAENDAPAGPKPEAADVRVRRKKSKELPAFVKMIRESAKQRLRRK